MRPRHKYDLGKDSRDWKVSEIQKLLKSTAVNEKYIKSITYRPFDTRYTYYTESKGVVGKPVFNIMKHILNIDNNIGLTSTRSLTSDAFKHAFVVSNITESSLISNKTSEISYFFPLYIIEEQILLRNTTKENFTEDFRNYIDAKYAKHFDPEEILGYIYAILHSNIYRIKFIEFLQIDFPKIIFVNDCATFEKLKDLGTTLINTHLLNNTNKLNNSIGVHISTNDSNTKRSIDKIEYLNDTKELIYNEHNKFINVPRSVYEFSIGNYQVIKTYLKYRKGRILSLDEIEHIENIIRILQYTLDIQNQIDLVISKCTEFY
ncbi:type ISP restriction/modification enzyme [Candidatus Borreliella tachyglossi]|uniref:type ISP restriction/modification enzyme n=1 Tax=Candidatus Borreliella tachyglossi TaxID=1964448 RepID=UPI004042A12A